MRITNLSFLFLSIIFCSCFSLSIDKIVEVNEEEDWLYIGGDPGKTNVSKSKSELNPPFNVYWRFDADGGLGKNCLSVSDAVLFANTLNGEFYAIDVNSGKSLGRTSTIGNSSFSTPVVFNNNIIIASSGKGSNVFSYNLVRGAVQWQRNAGWVESSPVLVGENIVLCSENGKLYKLDAKTGNIIWTAKPSHRKNIRSSFFTSPTVVNNSIIAGNIDGYMYSFDLTSGKELWKFKTDASIFCDASFKDGKIYFGSDDKNFYCIDTTGNLIWKRDLNTKFLSSSTFYNDMVIISGIDGRIYSLSKDDGSNEWSFQTNGAVWASPLLQDDKIFVGSFDKNFYCLNAIDGKELWKFTCEGRIKTSAVIWKDYIFVASDEKYIYCFSNLEMPKSSGE